MSKKQTPKAMGITSAQGSGTTRLRHNSGRFARNHAQPTKIVHAVEKTPAEPHPQDLLHEQAQRDLAIQEQRAKLKS